MHQNIEPNIYNNNEIGVTNTNAAHITQRHHNSGLGVFIYIVYVCIFMNVSVCFNVNAQIGWLPYCAYLSLLAKERKEVVNHWRSEIIQRFAYIHTIPSIYPSIHSIIFLSNSVSFTHHQRNCSSVAYRRCVVCMNMCMDIENSHIHSRREHTMNSKCESYTHARFTFTKLCHLRWCVICLGVFVSRQYHSKRSALPIHARVPFITLNLYLLSSFTSVENARCAYQQLDSLSVFTDVRAVFVCVGAGSV